MKQLNVMLREITVKYIHIRLRDLKEQNNSIIANHCPYSLKLAKRNDAIHVIFQLEVPDLPCKF